MENNWLQNGGQKFLKPLYVLLLTSHGFCNQPYGYLFSPTSTAAPRAARAEGLLPIKSHDVPVCLRHLKSLQMAPLVDSSINS